MTRSYFIFFVSDFFHSAIEHDAKGQNSRFGGGKRRSDEDEKAALDRQLIAPMSATVTSEDGGGQPGSVSVGVISKSGENEGKPVTENREYIELP